MNGIARIIRNVKRFFRSTEYRRRWRNRWGIARLDLAIAWNPKRIDLYMERALEYAWLNQHVLAIDDYTRVLALDPMHVKALESRAHVYDERRKYNEAIQDFSRAMEITPHNPKLFEGRSTTYLSIWEKTGEVDAAKRALEDLTAAIHSDPSRPWPYHCRGNAYMSIADATKDQTLLRKAIADFQKSIELYPLAFKFNSLGHTLMRAGEYDAAIRAIESALKLMNEDNSERTFSYMLRSKVREEMGDFKSAIDDNEILFDLLVRSHENLKNVEDPREIDLETIEEPERTHIADMVCLHYAHMGDLWQKYGDIERASEERHVATRVLPYARQSLQIHRSPRIPSSRGVELLRILWDIPM